MNYAFIRVPKTGSTSVALSLPQCVRWKDHEPLNYWLQRDSTIITFAFIRNPWERLYSWWRHESYFRQGSFKKYVMERALTERYVHGNYDTDLLIADQMEWIRTDIDEVVCSVGKFERLQADRDSILAYYGLGPPKPLAHEQFSPHGDAHPHSAAVWDEEMLQHMDPMFLPFARHYGYARPQAN